MSNCPSPGPSKKNASLALDRLQSAVAQPICGSVIKEHLIQYLRQRVGPHVFDSSLAFNSCLMLLSIDPLKTAWLLSLMRTNSSLPNAGSRIRHLDQRRMIPSLVWNYLLSSVTMKASVPSRLSMNVQKSSSLMSFLLRCFSFICFESIVGRPVEAQRHFEADARLLQHTLQTISREAVVSSNFSLLTVFDVDLWLVAHRCRRTPPSRRANDC